MKMEMGIGIIGHGFVGDAVAHGFARHGLTPYIYDAKPDRSEVSFERAATQEFVFVCVPTPSRSDGSMDFVILDSVVKQIQKLRVEGREPGTIVIKSTVLPGVVEGYRGRYPAQRFISNPEFLTQRTARDDFAKPSRVVIGTDEHSKTLATMALWAIYRSMVKADTPILIVSHDEAAMIKCACNSFFATKLSFMNEVALMCDTLKIDYGRVLQGMLTSGWVNKMHTQVPGPDGKYGFGGACLPKDLAAFADLAHSIGVTPNTMFGAIETNKGIRRDVYGGVEEGKEATNERQDDDRR